MRTKTFVILLSFICLGGTVSAQKKKTTSPAPSGLSLQDANKIIQYTNSMMQYLAECCSYKHAVKNSETYHRNIEQNTSEKRTSEDAFENAQLYNSKEDCVAMIESQGGVNPALPPKSVGADNQAFFKEKLVAIDDLLAKLTVANTEMHKYFDDNMQLINKKDKSLAQAELQKFDEMVQSIHQVTDEVYNKIYELGDKAEMVTLTKHPFVKEIMDMKKLLRHAEKATRLAQGDATTVEKNLPQLQSLVEQMQTNSNAYSNYEAFRKGEDPRLGEMRLRVKEFYTTNVIDFYKYIDELKTSYKGDKKYERSRTQGYLIQKYEYLVQDFNNFVEANNR